MFLIPFLDVQISVALLFEHSVVCNFRCICLSRESVRKASKRFTPSFAYLDGNGRTTHAFRLL